MEPCGTPVTTNKLWIIESKAFERSMNLTPRNLPVNLSVNEQCWILWFFQKTVNNGDNFSFLPLNFNLFIHYSFKNF